MDSAREDPDAALAGDAVITVSIADVDKMGVALHARYLDWLKQARQALFRRMEETSPDIRGGDDRMPQVEAYLRFIAPAPCDAVLHVHAAPAEVHRNSFRLSYAVFRTSDGSTLATGYTVHRVLGSKGRASRIPPELGALLHRELNRP